MSSPEQVLARLPSAYRAEPGPSVLRALVTALGGELPMVENALAAVMRAHWVDLADAGEAEIDDLARIAALYGLMPGEDEPVEAFREHLKRYVRTFLGGTVTVPGILRVSAEALGVRIEDPATGLDPWWRRRAPLVVTEPDGSDASWTLFGGHPRAQGSAPSAARITGRVDLSRGADLRAARTLTFAVDGADPVTVDLAEGAPDPAAISLDHIVARIGPVARPAHGRLVLTSPTTGTASRLELRPRDADATGAVLGLPQRVQVGADATPAVLSGAVPLPDLLDLTAARYLRLAIDGGPVHEIDLVAAGAADSLPRQAVVAAINETFPHSAALTPSNRLRLRSPSAGSASRLQVTAAPAQDAADTLLGEAARTVFGDPPTPARLVGTAVLAAAVNLRRAWRLRIVLDGGAGVDVDLRGADPAATTAAEMVARINAGVQAPVASFNGLVLRLTSQQAGAESRIEIGEPDADAAQVVLGLLPLIVTGSAEGPAQLAGRPLPELVDLSSRHRLAIRPDAGAATVVDLRPAGADPAAVPLAALVATLNARLGIPLASAADTRLVLTSPDRGAAARVVVEPLVSSTTRHYVSRIAITDDAALPLLGHVQAAATATAGTAAELTGIEHPLGTVDLRAAHQLRLILDEGEPVDVDCAGRRPRITTPGEIRDAINARVPGIAHLAGTQVVLRSTRTGAASRIAFGTPGADDALPVVLGGAPRMVRGAEAAGVSFVGLADLSAGVALPAGAALALGVDGADPVEVVVGDAVPARRTLAQLVVTINTTLGQPVAAHDGTHLLLTSPTRGRDARLAIAPPAGPDATAAVLGVPAPRTYTGADATSAELTGAVPLPDPVDLRRGRFLRFAVNGGAPVQADLADGATDVTAVSRDNLIMALNTAAGHTIGTLRGGRLVLTSPTTGLASRVQVLPALAADARQLIFGAVPDETRGVDPTPAELIGDVPLGVPADLSRGSRLRLAVDGQAPVVVDVAGPDPRVTTLAEVVAAIDAVVPGVARATPDARLALRSAVSVEAGSPRFLEVVEYPLVPRRRQASVQHASRIPVRNAGVRAAPMVVQITAPGGLAGPGLADPELRWSVHALDIVRPGESVWFIGGDGGVVQVRIGVPGQPLRDVDPTDLRVVPTPLVRSAAYPPDQRPAVLVLPTGQSRPAFLEGHGDRFNASAFGTARFAGAPWREDAVFDVSVLGAEPAPVFAGQSADHGAGATVDWAAHEPAVFEVNLPADLDRRYGGRFGEALFAGPDPHQSATDPDHDRPGRFTNLVTDPPEAAEDHLVTALRTRSALVTADLVTEVPIGFTVAALPTRGPLPLRAGRGDPHAALYLTAEGFGDGFVRISARDPGPSGAVITVAVEPGVPGTVTVEVQCAGDRFESARTAAAGAPVPEQATEQSAPARIGVLAARAAGIGVRLTRDRAYRPPPSAQPPGSRP